MLGFVAQGENEIEVYFESPNRYIKQAYAQCKAEGSSDATVGFPLLRKAHCMFGWDWGPRLPDAGIWRDIHLDCVTTARLLGVPAATVRTRLRRARLKLKDLLGGYDDGE